MADHLIRPLPSKLVNFWKQKDVLGGQTQFSRMLLLMRLSACTKITKKTNMALVQQSFYLLNAHTMHAK